MPMIKAWYIPILLLFLFACREQNIVLVNEIKTLDARWVRVSEQMTEMGKIIPKWTVQMEHAKTILQEMEFASEEIRDSIANEQVQIISKMKKVAKEFETIKVEFDGQIDDFARWQQEALKSSGENPERIKGELVQFQEQYEALWLELDSVRNNLHALAQNHNDLRKSLLEEIEWVQYEPISIR